MNIGDYHIIVKEQVREYLNQTLSSFMLQEGTADKQYKSILHYVGSYREDVWRVISALRSLFDKKIYNIAQSVSVYAPDIRTTIEVLSSALNERANSNKKSIDNQFGKGTAQNLYEHLRGRRSDFIENISQFIADREEILLSEEDEMKSVEKGGLALVILDWISYIKRILKEFDGVTPCTGILMEYERMLNPNNWIEQISKDVKEYILKNSSEKQPEDFDDRIQDRVQDVVGEMILTTPVWLLLEITDEFKYAPEQIIIEIIFVSMLSPDHLEKWDDFFRRVGVGSITLRIGKVLKYINK
jgi:hypothetical protein